LADRPAGPSISSFGERALIDRLRARVRLLPSFVRIGIGDDAAVLEADRGALEVLTTDSLIEGVHFRRDWTAARAIGEKAVAVNFSDLAAMGAAPRAVLLSLALPPDLPVADFDDLIAGVIAAAAAERAPLVGGNLTRSPGPLVVDVTALGSVRPRRMLERRRGRPGDELYLTGSIGAAASGLARLSDGIDRAALDGAARECVDRYERPVARVRCGRLVASSRSASAAIDLSDGLAEAARQLAEASGAGVELEAEAIPVHPGAAAWWTAAGRDPIVLSVAGGEDYELLFAVPPKRRRAFLAAMGRSSNVGCTRVGRLLRESGAWLSRGALREPLPTGFTHFQAAKPPTNS
jgi:thiamine-monophosphate kinase